MNHSKRRSVVLLLYLLAQPGPAGATAASAVAEPHQAQTKGGATPGLHKSCDITGRYHATLALEEEFDSGLCPSQRTIAFEFSISLSGKALVAKITKGAGPLRLQKSIKAEVAIQREDDCEFKLHVYSDNSSHKNGDYSDDTSLDLTLKQRGGSVTGTGNLERAVTASAGNATGSRSEQCSMTVTLTGRIDSW